MFEEEIRGEEAKQKIFSAISKKSVDFHVKLTDFAKERNLPRIKELVWRFTSDIEMNLSALKKYNKGVIDRIARSKERDALLEFVTRLNEENESLDTIVGMRKYLLSIEKEKEFSSEVISFINSQISAMLKRIASLIDESRVTASLFRSVSARAVMPR